MSSTDAGSFDYIVVGGGTAGLAIASRLAEDSSKTVLVLEAGIDASAKPEVVIPALPRQTWGGDIDWKFMTTPQEHSNNNSVYMPRGKCLGGSSVLNLMQLGRAPAFEYNAFEGLGIEGWNAAEFLKYFRKSQSLSYSEEEMAELHVRADPGLYGNGPIINTLPKKIADMYPIWLDACIELGLPFNPSATSGENLGIWPSANAIHPQSATRISSATAYYEPHKDKANFKVVTSAHVARILLKASASSDIIATGVEYVVDGILHIASAAREVILCAGSINTPQILELSGIGDKSVLEKHGIPIRVELPGVGKNLQDHYATPFVVETDSKYDSFDALLDSERFALELKLYQKQEGLLTTVPLSYGFLPPTQFAEDEGKLRSIAQTVTGGTASPKIVSLTKQWAENKNVAQLEMIFSPFHIPNPIVPNPVPKTSYFSFSLIVLHPFSRGSVHISSIDPLIPPSIDLAWGSSAWDRQVMLESIKFSRRLVSTEAMKAAGAREVAPGPEVKDEEGLLNYIREGPLTMFHPIGTAAMLPKEDGGVVDSRLRVYGVKGLRVADASIFPFMLGAHPMATVFAIAEKAADMIKEDNLS